MSDTPTTNTTPDPNDREFPSEIEQPTPEPIGRYSADVDELRTIIEDQEKTIEDQEKLLNDKMKLIDGMQRALEMNVTDSMDGDPVRWCKNLMIDYKRSQRGNKVKKEEIRLMVKRIEELQIENERKDDKILLLEERVRVLEEENKSLIHDLDQIR